MKSSIAADVCERLQLAPRGHGAASAGILEALRRREPPAGLPSRPAAATRERGGEEARPRRHEGIAVMADLYGGEVIHRVRAELAPHRRELRLYVLCRSGSGAWLARIAPFEELFFDERLVCGLTVRAALETLAGIGRAVSPARRPLRRSLQSPTESLPSRLSVESLKRRERGVITTK